MNFDMANLFVGISCFPICNEDSPKKRPDVALMVMGFRAESRSQRAEFETKVQ